MLLQSRQCASRDSPTWAGLDLDSFIIGDDRGEAASLPRISALLRADPHLSKESVTAIEEMLRATYEALRKDADRNLGRTMNDGRKG